jgi:ATP-dependent exoDNAse (exonuclease V) beta subunit
LRFPSSQVTDAAPAEPPAADAGPGPLAARLAGSAVHLALQRWDFQGHQELRARARSSLGLLLSRETSAGPGAAGEEIAAREIDRILDGFLASPLPARLGRSVILARGACDLIFREGDEIVVADYKTDAEAGARDAATRYRGQMALYLDAVRRVFPGERVRGEILLLRTGVAIPIDGSAGVSGSA